MDFLNFTAPCHFGLESVLAGELKRLDINNVAAHNGKVTFSGDYNTMARANICLRTAERVLLELGTFKATTFEELFQGVKALPLEEFIGSKDGFPVKGWSLNSVLKSIPDCQSIIKKAAVERLKSVYDVNWFEETGSARQIQFSILNDEVAIMIDTSGAGLHKRGYRRNSNIAPIKETLAAGILDIARVREYSTFYDPFCGSGTFLIEATTKALNIPPCLNRHFVAQTYGWCNESVWQDERKRGIGNIRKDTSFHAYGSDLDNQAVELTLDNAKKAGVNSKITVVNRDIKNFKLETESGIICCNPPYGERMLDIKTAEDIYQTMGKVFKRIENKSLYVISPSENFESNFGTKANKRRKLYNGMIKCQLYMYYDLKDKGVRK